MNLAIDGCHTAHFHHSASGEAVGDALWSLGGFPALVDKLTSGVVRIDTSVQEISRPLRSLTLRETNEFWPSPDDTGIELDRLAGNGKCDSVFVFWPQHDFGSGSSVPGSAWGLGMGASAWTRRTTYAVVSNASSSAWRNEARGEVWLHEWLHGVCHHFGVQGYLMPQRDADGAQLHGYQRSAKEGWTGYYRDLMSGRVVEQGKMLGIPRLAWLEFSGDSRIAAR